MSAMPAADAPLDALERALDAERRALIEHDVDALLTSTADKLAALRRVESAGPDPSAAARLSALRAFNQANGVLLARRRREVNWALRHLGRIEAAGTYDARGRRGARPQARSLAVI